MTPAISLAGVGRRYGQHQALADVTVDIGTPTITGLLGRNGAGKSTLLRIAPGQEALVRHADRARHRHRPGRATTGWI